MSMGKRRDLQEDLFVSSADLDSPGHPFYERLNRLLERTGFDAMVERTCAKYYADAGLGRPSLPPSTYFRMLFVGYFEGISSERELAWRCGDSLSLRRFLGLSLSSKVPDHSTLSLIRNRLDAHVFDDVFRFVLDEIAKAGLVEGRRVGIDSTLIEAASSMRGIARKEGGASYESYIKQLASESEGGTKDAPKASADDARRIDRKREKRVSNRDWQSPSDPDARIARMKNGTTRLAYKPEHAVDLDTGVVLAVTLNPADQSDHATLPATLDELEANFEHLERELEGMQLVADKGYHSAAALALCEEEGIVPYIAEPKHARWRNWRDKEDGVDAQRRCYANRRRTKGRAGRALMKRRANQVERSFSHTKHRGGWRRSPVAGREAVWKRYLVHTTGLNLGILMRAIFGAGTPKAMAGLCRAVFALFRALVALTTGPGPSLSVTWPPRPTLARPRSKGPGPRPASSDEHFSTAS